MESEPPDEQSEGKKERNFPSLDLQLTSTQPIFVVQSPKTPTLSRKLKAASLDSEPQKENANLEICRDVFSMPNTPKRQIKPKLLSEFSDEGQKLSLAPCFPSNLKKFASNTSISGSQTLKTLPEIMTLHDFSVTQNSKPEPVKTRPKGLLERRGSNASLTIDLGSNSSISEPKLQPLLRLNTAKSVSNLNLSTFGTADKCLCMKKFENGKKMCERRKSQEACRNCIIYESVPSKAKVCKNRCQVLHKRCMCTASKCRRKSLSNENLYVPPCGFCQSGFFKECVGSSKNCKGDRRACYPRQPDIEVNQLLSEDFKNHLQNMQYLQTAGNVLSIADLKSVCEDIRVPKLHQEFWEVPLNLQEKCYVSGSQTKNRYRGVLPNEHSRVHLPGVQPYIHANYIKGPDYTETNYIATQGPMAHTCQDFWNMVWFTNCQTIVMLTGLVEKGKNKCELYFPLGKKAGSPETSKYYVKTSRLRDKFTFDGRQNLQDNEEELVEFEALDEVTFGNYKIKYLSEENNLQNCPLRYLELSKMNDTNEVQESKRLIRHYWFTNWQDHKMADPRMVLEVALNVLDSFTDLENNEPSKTDSNLTISKDNTLEVQKVEKSINELKISDKLDVAETKNNKGGLKKFVFNSSDNSKNPFSYTESSNWVENSKEPLTNDDNPFDIRLRRTPRMMKSQRFTVTKSLEAPENKRKLVEIRKFSSCQGRERRKGSSDNLIESKEPYKAVSDAGGSPGTGELPKSTVNGIFSNHSSDCLKNIQAQRRKSAENIKVSLIVHCSAGIGRTGCFLAILNGIQQLKSNLNVDVLAILCSLRLNRGGMVQTAEQYELIHRVLNLFTEIL